MSYTSGSKSTSFDGTPQNQVVSGNQSILAGRFKLTSSYENYTAKEMRFTTGSSLPIASATLKDNATGATIATIPYDNTNSYFNFTGLNIAIPASTSKRVDLYWNLSVPSADASSTNVNAVATLTYVKFADSQGAETTDTNSRAANETYVFRAVPTISTVPLSNSKIINNAEMDLYKLTVAAPSQGTVSIKQLKFNVNWSDSGTADTLELDSLKFFEDGVDITSTVAITEEDSASDAESTNVVSENTSKIIVVWDGDSEESVITAGTTKTYTLKGSPDGFNETGATDTAKDSVAIQFVPDAAHQTAGYNYINQGTTLTLIEKLYSSATANASAENANLIWSDNSAVAHSPDDDAGTADWSNSYLFNSVSSQSLSF